MYDDLVKMVTWIVRIRGGTSASYLDPILRAKVTEDYQKHLATIIALKAAEDAARADGGQPPTDPLPIVIPVDRGTTDESIRDEIHRHDPANKKKRK